MTSRPRAFTLIELLLVVGILAALSVILILVLNPAELLRQSRDSGRLSDMETLTKALSLSQTESLPLGNASTVYLSLPDTTITSGTSNCASVGAFPSSTIPPGWNLQCTAKINNRNVDGTGWLPVNLKKLSEGSPIGSLPIDPLTPSIGQFYSYVPGVSQYEVTSNLESQKYQPLEQGDGGQYGSLFEKGSSLTLLPIDYGCSSNGPCVWITDSSGVYKYSVLGGSLGRLGSAGTFQKPAGIAVDSMGNTYIGDAGFLLVQKFNQNGTHVAQFGSAGSGNGQFSAIGGLAADSGGNVYVVDTGNNRVEKFNSNGTYLSQFGTTGSGNGNFISPLGIAINASNNIYVVDSGNNRVEEFDSNGNYLMQFGSAGPGNGQFNQPDGIALDANGNVYVASFANNQGIEEFSPSGVWIASEGSAAAPITYPTTGTLAIDSGGNFYIPDATKVIDKLNSSMSYLLSFGSSFTGIQFITVK
ncbi:MAG TPA: SMP-30/gluconolactonase/LRE family protein [Candidatus Paceibacterota bacterium]|nr:SMP-30/gluconolactonase/LRE family protein [Candidatus Paceibacterota bacterium]